MSSAQRDIIAQLRRDILAMEGFKPANAATAVAGLSPLAAAFPNNVFPTGAVHEFITTTQEQQAATAGFVTALSGMLLQTGGACLWVAQNRRINPAALHSFGLGAEQIVFADVKSSKDVLWATEEALKQKGLAFVVAEIKELDMIASRRLQLATEKSGVSCFVLRHQPRAVQHTASVARWQIRPLPSISPDGLPGLGHPNWLVELQKVRKGKPATWLLQWIEDHFEQPATAAVLTPLIRRKTG